MSEETEPAATTEPSMDELRQVKLRLPLRHVIRLNACHIITTKPVNEIVAEALRLHFAGIPGLSSAQRLAAP